VIVDAFAKLNLTLRVQPPGPNGLHPMRSLAVSIDWADRVELAPSERDVIEVTGADLPDGDANLAVRALKAVREAVGRDEPGTIRLTKRIPVAAGLGGGSSDAAAVLAMAARWLRLDPRARDALAPGLGADVAFFLTGGLARLSGFGEEVQRIEPIPEFHPAVVVPRFDLSTAAVYRNWDLLEGPDGPELPLRVLPPALRAYGPVVNDLTPAAIDLVPELGDWMSDLGRLWEVPVAMSGSGPSLFALFPTRGEAEGAAAAVPGTRAARGCSPTSRGRREVDADGAAPPGG